MALWRALLRAEAGWLTSAAGALPGRVQAPFARLLPAPPWPRAAPRSGTSDPRALAEG